VGEDDRKPLSRAAIGGHSAIVQLLLAKAPISIWQLRSGVGCHCSEPSGRARSRCNIRLRRRPLDVHNERGGKCALSGMSCVPCPRKILSELDIPSPPSRKTPKTILRTRELSRTYALAISPPISLYPKSKYRGDDDAKSCRLLRTGLGEQTATHKQTI
jgi:hypothetical protein